MASARAVTSACPPPYCASLAPATSLPHAPTAGVSCTPPTRSRSKSSTTTSTTWPANPSAPSQKPGANNSKNLGVPAPPRLGVQTTENLRVLCVSAVNKNQDLGVLGVLA